MSSLTTGCVKRQSGNMIRNLHAEESGQMAVLMLLMVMVIFMLATVAFDFGLWAVDHRLAQNEVDGAAHAAAVNLVNTPEPTTVPVSSTAAQARAVEWLTSNGIPNPELTPAIRCNWGWFNATDSDGDGNYNQTEVCLKRDRASFFGSLAGISSATISARAVARFSIVPSRYAIMVMDPDECQSFRIAGTAIVTIVDVNGLGQGGSSITLSNSTCAQGALNVGGSGIHLTGVSHEVNGGYSACPGCIVGTVIQPATEFEDPWINLTPPSLGSCLTPPPGGWTFNSGTHVLQPGTYCTDIGVGGGAQVTVRPGVYVLRDADIVVSPSAGPGGFFCARPAIDPADTTPATRATCTVADDTAVAGVANEVLFYSTCNPSPCAGGATAGQMDFGGGGGLVRLNGRTAYEDMLFWIDRYSNGGLASTSEVKIVGSSTTELNGHVYAFSSDANITGGSSGTPAVLNLSIMSNTLSYTGNSNLIMMWDPMTAPKLERLAIVE